MVSLTTIARRENSQQSSGVSSATSNSAEWLSMAAVAFEEQAMSVLTGISGSLGLNNHEEQAASKDPREDGPVKTVITWKNNHSGRRVNKQQQCPATVIHSTHDGAEVTLADYSYPSSLTFDDPVEEDKTLCLKILRGAHLSTSTNLTASPFCQVLVDGVPIGETPVREQTESPIFGGPQSTFRVEGSVTTKITIQVWDRSTEAPKQLGCIKFTVEQVLCQDHSSNPNMWLYLQPTNTALSDNTDSSPRLQIRLIPAVQFSPLQPQPSTKCLQAGPELPLINSFAVRKLILASTAPVTLHVYDVSNKQTVQDINYYTKAMGAGGIFHGAVEIHGREYSFGGSQQRRVTGIFGCPPKRCVFHHYRESIYLGDCELSPQQVKLILKQMEPQWMAQSYNLFHKNCTTFSREFAIELGVGTIPQWVYSLGETAEPYLVPYLEYAKNRAKEEEARKKGHNKYPAVEGEKSHQVLVDHVMAARVQRSFRAKMASRRTVIV